MQTVRCRNVIREHRAPALPRRSFFPVFPASQRRIVASRSTTCLVMRRIYASGVRRTPYLDVGPIGSRPGLPRLLPPCSTLFRIHMRLDALSRNDTGRNFADDVESARSTSEWFFPPDFPTLSKAPLARPNILAFSSRRGS